MRMLSTGQVAKICKVAPRTVVKWFDSGRLKGHRVPGSRFRRIPEDKLIEFMKEHGVPLGGIENEITGNVLVISEDALLIENVQIALPGKKSWQVQNVASTFDAGIKIHEWTIPDCIVIDFAISILSALRFCSTVAKQSQFNEVAKIALLGNADEFDKVHALVDEMFRKPFDAKLLTERIKSLVETKKELV